MSELKLCPFCGNEPSRTPNHTIICNTCHREVLPEVWNTRPIEDALQKQLLNLRQSLKEAVEKIENERKDLHEKRICLIEERENTILVCERYSSLTLALDIIREHGLIEGK